MLFAKVFQKRNREIAYSFCVQQKPAPSRGEHSDFYDYALFNFKAYPSFGPHSERHKPVTVREIWHLILQPELFLAFVNGCDGGCVPMRQE